MTDDAQRASVDDIVATFERPKRLWFRSECLAQPSPVPKVPGLYGWYFRELPPGVDGQGCAQASGYTLLYVGIAPSRALGVPGHASTSNLRSRIRQHCAGSAEGSTLRLSLGSLLASPLGLTLDPGRKSKSFGRGEAILSDWIGQNACLTWVEHPEPWSIEPSVISRLDLPLNLAHNRNHPFWPYLTEARSQLIRSKGTCA